MDTTEKRRNTYEDTLCVTGIGGGIFTLLLPFLVPYLGDVVWVTTLTVLNLWITRSAIHRFFNKDRRALLRPPRLRAWMFINASLTLILVMGAETLQYLDAVPGVFDPYDFAAFGAGYVITLSLLAAAYRKLLRYPNVESSLW